MVAGCSSYQPTKNVWKGTKDVWYTYVSPPASVDYGEKGDLSPRALALTNCMMGLDVELGRFERTMINADKPPTRQWMDSLFAAHPWLDGFAGVKYDGTLLGQEPANPLKQLDFIPLLYEDKKQGSRALRAGVQQTPMGPEVMLAAPLYDGVDFLGIVVAYFDMRNLVQYSGNPQDMVILSPQALLWPGKYDYAATPLASVNWEEAVTKSSSGTCTNATGSFYYMVRYLGNLPLVFAVAESGTFPQGNGSVDQGLPFFPKEKLPPPPMPERKKDSSKTTPAFGASEDAVDGYGDAGGMPPQDVALGASIVQPPQESAPAPSRVRERPLAGENVKPRPRRRLVIPDEALTVPELPEETAPAPQVRMPSPFGPRGAAKPAAEQGGVRCRYGSRSRNGCPRGSGCRQARSFRNACCCPGRDGSACCRTRCRACGSAGSRRAFRAQTSGPAAGRAPQSLRSQVVFDSNHAVCAASAAHTRSYPV